MFDATMVLDEQVIASAMQTGLSKHGGLERDRLLVDSPVVPVQFHNTMGRHFGSGLVPVTAVPNLTDRALEDTVQSPSSLRGSFLLSYVLSLQLMYHVANHLSTPYRELAWLQHYFKHGAGSILSSLGAIYCLCCTSKHSQILSE